MAATSVLKIDIIADATKAVAGMKDTTDAASGIGSSFKGLAKTIGPAIGTAAVVGFGKASVQAAQDSAVATARLDQIFLSMGDSTGQASKAAQDYASAMSEKIGVDDDAIKAGQAQLATFGSVSSETARMAGIFDRATMAGADLAAAGFGSIDSNAVQLGKALEDPTKGMTALAKSGVTFTDSQKDQIKAMQESGDLLGAQQIVLAAVEKQVGGTAEATATSTGKMSVAFGEMQEELGAKLLPIISKLADFFTKYMDVLLPLGGIVLGIVAATKVWSAIQLAFNVIMAANPVTLVVLAIVALIAAIVLAYHNVDWFRALVDTAFQAIVAAFGWLKDAASAVFDWVSSNWPLLLAILLGPFGILITVVVKNFDTIMDVIKGIIAWITANWPLLLAILTGPIGLAVLFIVRNFDTLRDAAKAVVDWVQDRFTDLTGFLSRIVQTFSSVLGSIADAIRLPIQAATDMAKWVIDKIQGLADFIRDIVTTIGGYVGNIVSAFKDPINDLIRGWNAIEFGIPGVDVGPVHFGGITIGTPNIPELAKGGLVMRTGLALVHEGETFSGVGKTASPQTVNIIVNTTGLGADAPQIQRAVVHALRGHAARNGPLPPFVTGAPTGAP